MDIERTFRREGELWGETSDGGLVRWSNQEARWERVASESRPAEPGDVVTATGTEAPTSNGLEAPPDPNFYAVPAFGAPARPLPTSHPNDLMRAAGITGPSPYEELSLEDPNHPINKWWNRKFPPYSWARLAFGVAALPVVGVVHAAYSRFVKGDEVTVAAYLFSFVVGAIALAVVFIAARAKGAHRQVSAAGVAAVPAPRRLTMMDHARDLAISTAILFVGFIVFGFFMLDEADGILLLISLALALLTGVIIHFRLFGLAIAIGAALVGAGVAFFLHLFSLLWGQESSFIGTWLIVTGMAMVAAIPLWFRVRWAARQISWVPSWAMAIVVSVLLMAMPLFVTVFESQQADGGATSAADSPLPSPSPSKLVGASSRQAAARQLYDAWRSNSREGAARVARVRVVDELFSIRYAGQPFKGCGNYQAHNVCVIESGKELLLLGTDMATIQGQWLSYIRYMMRVPAGTQIKYFSPQPSA